MSNSKIQCFAKIGFQGGTGAGKSATSMLLLLGLSVTYHDKAPVEVFDTEPGWSFFQPMYKAEGVELIIEPGRSFDAMQKSLALAKSRGCCGFAVDSITHPWGELLSTFANPNGKVPFHRFNQIRQLWAQDWTVDFMDAPMHCIADGRLTFEYEYVEDEEGNKDLVKGNSKMKAGGSESFGYEPHLTCEMRVNQKRNKSGKLSGMQHICTVLKDRTWALNGKEFAFGDIQDYKPGDFKSVLTAFTPHLKRLQDISGVTLGKGDSRSLVRTNEDWGKAQNAKKIAIEDFDETIDKLWPGQSADAKKVRRAVCEFCFEGIRSRTEMENQTLDKLEAAKNLLRSFEQYTLKEKMPDTVDGILNVLFNLKQEAVQVPF